MKTRGMLPALLAAALLALAAPFAARAQEPFFAGKRITILVATGAGGDHDVYGRLLARHLGKHVPGNPGVVVQNMPGANGITAGNFAANSGARDGSLVLLATQNLPMTQALGASDLRFDLANFSAIGNMLFANTVAFAWRGTGVRTLGDAKTRELLLGSTAPNSLGAVHAALMNTVLGTKFRIVNGYKSAQEIDLAIERGEVNARAAVPWAAIKSMHPDWLARPDIDILVQAGLAKERELPDTPLLVDLGPTAEDRQLLAFFSSIAAVGRPFFTPPGVPADRVETLRRAFDAAMADPDLLADAARENLDVSPLPGVKLQQVVRDLMATDAALVKRARDIAGAN